MILETQEVIPHIVGLFESACIKQLESLDCEIKRVDQPGDHSDELSAYIEASSEDLKIQLLLHTPKSMLTNTMPDQNTDSITESMREDWVLELSNRFLGRLKNKLVDHNCVLRMGFPKSCHNGNAKSLIENEDNQIVMYFDVDGKIMECCIYVNVLNKDLTLDLYEDEDEDWFDESELEHL